MFTVGPAMWGGDGDTLFGQVQFLLSPQSMPIGTTANDQSAAALPSTLSGTAAVSNTTQLFGGPSLRFPGGSDYFSYAYVPAGLNTQNFCIEAWLYLDSADYSAPQALCCHNVIGAGGYVVLYIDGGGKLVLGSAGSSTSVVPTGRWVHLAVTSNKSPNEVRYFIDGVIDSDTNIGFAAPLNLTELRVGNGTSGSGCGRLKGALGGLRLTIGSKRYADGGFAVPGTPFPTA